MPLVLADEDRAELVRWSRLYRQYHGAGRFILTCA
jgi:hypothetical protein